jgi:hypothetical protein
MTQSRTSDAGYRLGLSTVVLLGLVMVAGPTIAGAAEGQGEPDTVAVAVPGSGSTGSREPSRDRSIVIRGTRPAPTQPVGPSRDAEDGLGAAGGLPIGPYSGGWFNPALTSRGWDSTYDYGGLTPATTPH